MVNLTPGRRRTTHSNSEDHHVRQRNTMEPYHNSKQMTLRVLPKQTAQESVKMFKILFLVSLFLTLMVNVSVFLFTTKDKPPDNLQQAREENISNVRSINNYPQLKLRRAATSEVRVAGNQEEHRDKDGEEEGEEADRKFHAEREDRICDNEQTAKKIHIRVKSSKNHVFVSANDLIIYESKSAAEHVPPPENTTATASSYQPAGGDNNLHHLSADEEETFGGDQEEVDDEDDERDAGRGIHVVVLNEFNGFIMAKRVFDTYSPGQDDELSTFLDNIRDGRILVFAIKDEASFKMAAYSSARRLLQKQLGSQHIMKLGWRDMWAFVVQKKSSPSPSHRQISDELDLFVRGKQINAAQVVASVEGLMKSSGANDWAPAVELEATLRLRGAGCGRADPTSQRCAWSRRRGRHQNRRRLEFCSRTEGYAAVCDCERPAKIEFSPRKIHNSQLESVPIVVMASNRAHYLYRMLRSLLAADGVNSSLVTVFIDGYYEEPLMVSQLFNLRTVQQAPVSRRSARISHHYKSSLSTTFDALFPRAEFAILFEEDLDIAPDAMIYFNQTLELLRRDPSLYCASAWNDQGYEHSTGADSGLLYRIETMPGLGWMLSRKLFKEELQPNWPSARKPHDWDMWIRTRTVRKGRECIIPDLSRTFHFGAIGTNINSYFQSQYFTKHAFFNGSLRQERGQTQFRDLDKLTRDAYEQHMERLISEASPLMITPEQHLCSQNGTTLTNSSVIFIEMIDEHDYANWLRLAKCWRIWDLDARGQHKSMWRLFLNGQPVYVVGVPASPYAKFKPAHVKPLAL